MLIDIYSRKIVGWEVHETESAAFAAALINRACLAEGTCRTALVLHSEFFKVVVPFSKLFVLQFYHC